MFHPASPRHLFSLKTLQFYKIERQGWQHISDLIPEEASTLKVQVNCPDPPSVPNVADVLNGLKEDNATLRSQLEQMQVDMGLYSTRRLMH